MFQPGPWHDRLVTSFAALHDLTGKVAVVTGRSRGIGRAIVQTLAEAGADAVIASRKPDACEAAAEQVRTSTGRRAVAIACHVGRWGDCDRLIAETLAWARRPAGGGPEGGGPEGGGPVTGCEYAETRRSRKLADLIGRNPA